jgi:soluble lytic murein transglycosylase-like protein
MPHLANGFARLHAAPRAALSACGVFAKQVGRSVLEVGRNSLAWVGVLALGGPILVMSHVDMRAQIELGALEWLQTREEERALAAGNAAGVVAEPAPEGGQRATAADLATLPHQQATLAQWIARRYKVAPEPVAALVQEAWQIGQHAKLDPTLILAIMAIESSFNPFAQSAVGAQGLMQVHTKVHDDKFVAFGGQHAAFDPISNLRVGVQVLKDCIQRAGSVQDGLRHYVGAALLGNDGGYADRVMAEQAFMRSVADGKRVPVTVAPKLKPAQQPVSAQPALIESVALLR